MYLESCTSQPEVRGKTVGVFADIAEGAKNGGVVHCIRRVRRIRNFGGLKRSRVEPTHALGGDASARSAAVGVAAGNQCSSSLPIPVPEISVPCSTVIGRPLKAEMIH